jgi:hypothetical protein
LANLLGGRATCKRDEPEKPEPNTQKGYRSAPFHKSLAFAQGKVQKRQGAKTPILSTTFHASQYSRQREPPDGGAKKGDKSNF